MMPELSNLATVYHFDKTNIGFNQSGDSTSSSTSKKDVQRSSTSTTTTTYTPSPLEVWWNNLIKKDDKELQNLATVYHTDTTNVGFNQSGDSTSSSTSKKDVQRSSTSTTTTTYTPSPLEVWWNNLIKKDDKELMNLADYDLNDPIVIELAKKYPAAFPDFNKLQNLATVYHTDTTNVGFNQSGDSTSSSTSKTDT